MTTEVRIHLSANSGPAFGTSEAGFVAAVRAALDATIPLNYSGPRDRNLVPAHDLAAILRTNGRAMWAKVLDREEDTSMALVVFTH